MVINAQISAFSEKIFTIICANTPFIHSAHVTFNKEKFLTPHVLTTTDAFYQISSFRHKCVCCRQILRSGDIFLDITHTFLIYLGGVNRENSEKSFEKSWKLSPWGHFLCYLNRIVISRAQSIFDMWIRLRNQLWRGKLVLSRKGVKKITDHVEFLNFRKIRIIDRFMGVINQFDVDLTSIWHRKSTLT